jgi:hypothetical protein
VSEKVLLCSLGFVALANCSAATALSPPAPPPASPPGPRRPAASPAVVLCVRLPVRSCVARGRQKRADRAAEHNSSAASRPDFLLLLHRYIYRSLKADD